MNDPERHSFRWGQTPRNENPRQPKPRRDRVLRLAAAVAASLAERRCGEAVPALLRGGDLEVGETDWSLCSVCEPQSAGQTDLAPGTARGGLPRASQAGAARIPSPWLALASSGTAPDSGAHGPVLGTPISTQSREDQPRQRRASVSPAPTDLVRRGPGLGARQTAQTI